MSQTDYFLTTGEFAKLCSTTKDTLRHYHEIGILIPQKNEENGYFYYSVSQVTAFYFISMFRQLDTPLKDIKTCLTASADMDYYNFCRGQLNSLVRMRSEIDKKIVALSNATMLMHHMKRIPEGQPHIFRFRERTTYIRTPIISKNALHASDIIEDIQRHIEYCNKKPEIITFPISATIAYEDFCNEKYQYKQLCSTIAARANDQDVFQMPSHKVVGCSCMDGSINIKEHFKTLRQYIHVNKLAVISDLFSINLFNFMDTQTEHRYLKYIFFCIEDDSISGPQE